MPYTFFLSYSRTKNSDGAIDHFFERLLSEIKTITGKEATAFMDTHEIQGGDVWEMKITESLKDASVLIILLSTAWLNSDNCLKEYKIFKNFNDERKRYIIPLIWRKIYDEEIITEEHKEIMRHLNSLNSVNWIELSNNVNYHSSTELKAAIANLADLMKRKILGIS